MVGPAERRIPLKNRAGEIVAWTLVDEQDYDSLAQHNWSLRVGYVRRHVKCADGTWRPIHMHRAILGIPPAGMTIDHINRDRLDNRRANLRLIPRAGNQHNLPSHRGARSPYRGVSFHKASRLWHARVTIAGHCNSVGYYHTEEEAHEAAQAFRLKHMAYAVD